MPETAQDKQTQKYIRMTTGSVKKLVCRMAIPTIISMLVTALYNIADTFFVGQIGTAATAGVGLVFPVMTIIQAFGFFFGQGSGNFISRALGARKTDEAERMAAVGSISALLFGGVILLCGTLFKAPILHVLGARGDMVSGDTVRYAGDYLRVILIGAPFMCMSCVLNNQMRFQGNAVFSMVGLVSGAVLNCALDPLFIFAFGMEVTGAALATAISQFVSCGILFIGTLRSDSLKIRLRNFRPNFYFYKNIFIGGAPSLFRQGLGSIAVLCLNSAAGNAGALEETAVWMGLSGSAAEGVSKTLSDAAVAAFSVVSKIMSFCFSAVLGFGQGFQPVCGFNWGAKKYDRVRRAYVFCLKVGLCVLAVLSVAGFILAEPLVRLFRDDPYVVRFGAVAMRCQYCTFTLMAVVTVTNMLYQNIGRVVGATLLAVARQGLMFIPVVLILPHIITPSIWGVYLAQPMADMFSFLLAVPLGIRMYRELKRREKEMETAAPDAAL
ncbi:MAG: MATE family efflux transporter [Clostridiales bacterium]|nr:MATE family efflux transporter [Clostridiales bacterium]